MSTDITRVLLSPHISEKSSGLAEHQRQHTFKVLPTATKRQIRTAVEKLFHVEVENVNVINMRGKVKQHGRQLGQRRHWKKAYVTLAEGHDIEFSGTE